MPDVGERLDKVEQGLVQVDQRLESVEGQIRKLQVLEEENAGQIKLIAEVQAHHGSVLQKVVDDIEPLKVLPDLLTRVVQDHERRLASLEKRAGL